MEQAQLMPNDYLIAQGLIWRSEIGYTGIVAAGTAFSGITTGDERLVILQRSYSSTQSSLTVELFEASWTDGVDARTLNRILELSGEAKPAVVKTGVTPGALGNAITGVTLRAATSTGNAAVSISGDDSRLYLKPNTQYIVRYTNTGTAAADISNAFDYRKALRGNWERIIGSA